MIRGHDDFVHVRGEEIALNPIIDGVAFWENPHAMFSAGVSPDIIETANVMTGAFPAEYGNRCGGGHRRPAWVFRLFLLRRGARLEPVPESSRPGSHHSCPS